MRIAERPLARKRTPAVFNRLAPPGDYRPRASPFHGRQRLKEKLRSCGEREGACLMHIVLRS